MSTPTTKDLMKLAEDLNGLLGEAANDPVTNIIGAFSVCPSGWGPGSISFESWGGSWNDDCDERPETVDFNTDEGPVPIPLRDHMINEMEVLAKGILKFVELARQADQENEDDDAPTTDGVTCDACGMGYTWGTTETGEHAADCPLKQKDG